MTDTWVGIDEPATIDKRFDTEQRTINGFAVLRERLRLAGDGERYADVNAASELLVHDADVLAQLVVAVAHLANVVAALAAPVSIAGSVSVSNFPASVEVSNDVGNAIPISGTVTANLGTIDGAATEATLGSVLTELGQKLEAGQEVALDAATLTALETITATQGTSPWVVSGTVSVTEPVTVDAVDLDIRDLSSVTDSVSAVVTSLPVSTYTATAVDATASGENVIVNPGGGLAVRLHYITLANSHGTTTVTVGVRFGTGSADVYKVTLRPGSIWARNIGAGRRYLQGAADADLIVNLSTAVTVNVSAEYEEV